MKRRQAFSLAGGTCVVIGVILALAGSPAWALFVVGGGMLWVFGSGRRRM